MIVQDQDEKKKIAVRGIEKGGCIRGGNVLGLPDGVQIPGRMFSSTSNPSRFLVGETRRKRPSNTNEKKGGEK